MRPCLHAGKQADVCILFEHALADCRQPIGADPVYAALLLFELVDLQLLQSGGAGGIQQPQYPAIEC